jgi:hypothetical protein
MSYAPRVRNSHTHPIRRFLFLTGLLAATLTRPVAADQQPYDSLSTLLDSIEEIRDRQVYSSQSRGIRIHGEVRGWLNVHHTGSPAYDSGSFSGVPFKGMLTNEFGKENGHSGGHYGYRTYRGPDRLDFCNEANEPFFRLKIDHRPYKDVRLRLSLALTTRLLGSNAFTERHGHWMQNFTQAQLFEEFFVSNTIGLPWVGRTDFNLGGVLWQEYTPLTLWDSKTKVFPFIRAPWEDSRGSLERYKWYMLAGEQAGANAWNKAGIKGLTFTTNQMPHSLRLSGHFGILRSPWSERYVKVRQYGGYKDLYGTSIDSIRDDEPYVRQDILDTIAANQRFNDEWTTGAHLSWNPPAHGGSAALTYMSYFNTNKGYNYLDDGGADYYSSYHAAADNLAKAGATTLQVGPDYSSHILSLSSDLNIHTTKLQAEAAWSHLRFDNAGITDTAMGEAVHPALAGYSLAETPFTLGELTIPLRLRLSYVQPHFYSNSRDNMNTAGDLITPLTYRYEIEYRQRTVDGVETAYFDKTKTAVNNLAAPDIHTIIPRVGDERLVANSLGIFGKLLAPIPNGHCFLSFNSLNELEPSDNRVEFPLNLSGPHLYFAVMNNPLTIGHYFNDFALGYPGRGDASMVQLQRRQKIERTGDGTTDTTITISSSRRQVGGTMAAGLKTDYRQASEVFQYFDAQEDTIPAAVIQGTTLASGNALTEVIRAEPMRKQTRVLGLDVGLDLADILSGLSRSTVLELVLQATSVNEQPGLLPTTGGEGTIVSGQFGALTAVQQLSSAVNIVAMAGFERWDSPHAWRISSGGIDTVTSGNTTIIAPDLQWVRTPIHYRDHMYGIGMDWDVTSRTGFFLRLTRYVHTDPQMVDDSGREMNSYDNVQANAEVKLFF